MSAVEDISIVVALVKVDGAPIEDDVFANLSFLRVSRALGTVGHAEVRFRDDEFELTTTFAVGSRLEIFVVTGTTETSIFAGDITAAGIEMSFMATTFTVEALDDARKLGNSINLSSDLNTTASDVISAIAGDAGLTPDVTTTSTTFDHLQVHGTPLQYLDMLASRYGYVWYVDGTTLTVKERQQPSAVSLEAGVDLLGFRGRVSTTGLPTSVEVRSWDPDTKESIVGTADVTNTPEIDVAGMSGALEENLTMTVIRAGVPTQAEANAVAQGLAARIAAMIVSGSGETSADPAIVPGGQVELSNLGDNWSGTYHVTGVEHTFGADLSFVTRFTVGPNESGGLTGLLGRRAGVTSNEQMVSGISIGVVTDITDPDGKNRVKVKIPNIADDHETFWSRVVCPGAGNNRGFLAMPEIGDEVAVAYENGDIQRPYVLGGLWNGVDAIPDNHTVVDNHTVGARSITTRGGAYLALSDDPDDTEGARYIKIVTANQSATVHIGEDNVTIDAPDLPLTFKNAKAEIEIKDDGAINITAKQGNLTLDAKTNDVVIKGNNVKLTATSNAEIKASVQATLKGDAGATVDAGGAIAAVKGSMVNLN